MLFIASSEFVQAFISFTWPISSVQSLCHDWLSLTLWDAASQTSRSITKSQSLLKLMSIELVIASNHFIPCCPLLLLPSILNALPQHCFLYYILSAVQSLSWVDSLQPHGLQHAKLSCPSPTPGAWWYHPTISSAAIPFPPAFNLSQHQGRFKHVSSSHQVAKVLEFQLHH